MKDTVTMLVFGDFGTGSAHQFRVGQAMARVCKTRACDFAIGLGDNIYQNGVKSASDPQFVDKFELPYEGLGALDIWMTLGNHDWHQNAQAQVLYSLLSERWAMLGSVYSVPNLPSWLQLVAIDSTAVEKAPEIAKEQREVASGLLCRGDGWRLAFGHHPAFSTGKHGSHPKVQEFLEGLDAKCGLDVYFSGHDHHQELLESPRFTQVVQGAAAKSTGLHGGAAASLSRFAVAERGFSVVTITNTTMEVEFFDAHGELLHRSALNPKHKGLGD